MCTEIVRDVRHFFPEPHVACRFQASGLWKNFTSGTPERDFTTLTGILNTPGLVEG